MPLKCQVRIKIVFYGFPLIPYPGDILHLHLAEYVRMPSHQFVRDVAGHLFAAQIQVTVS